MRKSLTTLLIVLNLLIVLLQNSAFAKQRQNIEAYVIWHHQPIPIGLPVGKTRTLKFPHTVRMGMPSALSQHLMVKNNAGLLQLTALKPFLKQRIEVRDNVTRHKILIDLSAGIGQSDTPLAILYKKPNTDINEVSGWLKEPTALNGALAFITLTRFAQQQLYAPKRLLKNPYDIRLINRYMDRDTKFPKNNRFYGLFLDNSTINIPWGEWFGGQYYVTAVLVRNQLSVSIDLTRNITNICGRENGVWKAVTFFPAWHLARAGNLHDTTVAFLISSVPFDQAIKQCKDQ